MGLKIAKKYNCLKAEDLKWISNPKQFNFDSTAKIEPNEGIIGQEKAIKALQVGIEIKSPGYNIFVTGLSGTGKLSTIEKVLETITPLKTELDDYVYVNNFTDEDRPVLLVLPAGVGNKFKKDLAASIKFLQENIPIVLESEQYILRKKSIVEKYGESQQKLYLQFETKLQKDGFTLGQSKSSEIPQPEILIIRKSKAYFIQQMDELLTEKIIDKKEVTTITKKYASYQQELQLVLKKGIKLSQEYQTKVSDLEKEHAGSVINAAIDEIKLNYDYAKIKEYIDLVKEDILQNLDVFSGHKESRESTEEGIVIDYLKSYEVNVILDSSDVKGVPVIVETYPTYNNLFGTIDKMSDGRGGWYTDFTKIKAGSLLKANNGYLILRAADSFNEPSVWKTLKRVLLYGTLEMQDSGNYYQVAPSVLKPEAIKINTKIIFLGNNEIYSILSNYEEDFNKIFKIKAEFDYEMNRTEKAITEYASVIKKIIKNNNLNEFNNTAITKLLEYSARYAGSKNKLTTRFAYISDLMLEAAFWAKNEGEIIINDTHVKRAYENGNERHGMYNTKITEMMKDGMILIDVKGERIGQINGLAVYGDERSSFGKPTRITASISLGTGNILNVERESGLSGSTHNKGVLIITGFIRELFGKNIPLSFNASLVFEQGYGMIDGDSASITEIAALLSCLAEIPINQQFAITGSINQKGDIQPIGGVNEKIEGFFDICKMQGFTGKQGVIIPFQNIQDLMLKDEVIEEVKKKKFSIYAVKQADEALELLMGVKAGTLQKNNKFEKDTIYGKAEANLILMQKKLKPSTKKTASRKTKAVKKQL
ncbi:MAG: ATP-binding protein [bacterium]